MNVQNLDAKIKNCSCENWNLEHWSKISQGNKHLTKKLQFADFDDIFAKTAIFARIATITKSMAMFFHLIAMFVVVCISGPGAWDNQGNYHNKKY